MNMLFLGDSITKGIPGVSYVSKIQDSLIDINLVNRGIGGDTISSLFKRVKKMNDLESFDQIVLFVGVNDVFGKLSIPYKILKTLTRQRWAKNSSLIKKQYEELISFVINENKNIIIIPPILIGENLDSIWNEELLDLIKIIHDISINENIAYLELHNEFEKYLMNKVISDYLPIKLTDLLRDVKMLTTESLVDQKSRDRGLQLTLDGVHINSRRANIISKAIINYINNL